MNEVNSCVTAELSFRAVPCATPTAAPARPPSPAPPIAEPAPRSRRGKIGSICYRMYLGYAGAHELGVGVLAAALYTRHGPAVAVGCRRPQHRLRASAHRGQVRMLPPPAAVLAPTRTETQQSLRRSRDCGLYISGKNLVTYR